MKNNNNIENNNINIVKNVILPLILNIISIFIVNGLSDVFNLIRIFIL